MKALKMKLLGVAAATALMGSVGMVQAEGLSGNLSPVNPTNQVTTVGEHRSVSIQYHNLDGQLSIYVEGVMPDLVKGFTFNGVPVNRHINDMLSNNLAEFTEQGNGFVLSLVLQPGEEAFTGGIFGIITTDDMLLSSEIPAYVVNGNSEAVESPVTQTVYEEAAGESEEAQSSGRMHRGGKDCLVAYTTYDKNQRYTTSWKKIGTVSWPGRQNKCLNKALDYAKNHLKTTHFSPLFPPQRICDTGGQSRSVYADTTVRGLRKSRDGWARSTLGVSCIRMCDCPPGKWYDSNRKSCVTTACQNTGGIPNGDKGGGYFAWQGILYKNVPGATNCRLIVK